MAYKYESTKNGILETEISAINLEGISGISWTSDEITGDHYITIVYNTGLKSFQNFTSQEILEKCYKYTLDAWHEYKSVRDIPKV